MENLSKVYNPKEVEEAIYQKWEASGFFNPDKLEVAHDRYWNAEIFSMAMPPPNATGELHVGHAMMLAIEDLMIRFARMSGKKTLWLPGTDHAAIATQNVVEREIWEKEKKTRHDLGREELLRRIEEFVGKTRGRIQQQIRKMGSSCDWSREKYTLSPELSLAVRTVFKKMYDAGLIYRGERIVNWCPRCSTTLADDEVIYKPTKGHLYYVRYPLKAGRGLLIIATTRPETMLADTAVAVHPKDPRYQKYIGQSLMLPLLNRELKVIAEESVDREFGTGVLKITPGHDAHDFEIGLKHKLEVINLFTAEGKINEEEAFDHGFEDYANLGAHQARDKIVKSLADEGFLEKTEDITHNVGFCYRCDTIIEPIISKQWFVNVNQKSKIKNQKFQKLLKLQEEASLKEMAIAAVKNGAIKIVPDRFAKVYLHWMDNLRDWNISRQIWFGHRIPVWYCGESKQSNLKEMGFHESVVSQVLEGKTKTYRLRDHGFKVGDQVTFKNSQTSTIFGYGTITNIEKTTVSKIHLSDPAHGATYQKRQELIERFKLHYPGYEVTNNTEVLIYTYSFSTANAASKPSEYCGEVIVVIDGPAKCPNCGNTNLSQDPDTLDTWFSSSLWTFSTLGWPEETADLKIYHPTTILETGYDILFFWVARMIIMTGFALEDIPFHTVYLHGLIRDIEGKKMSKSKGNILNPLSMIEKYGTDALRLSLLLGTTTGNDIKVPKDKIQSQRNFINKLWNIARFILGQTEKRKLSIEIPEPKTLADEWIFNKLLIAMEAAQKNLAAYQFGMAGEILLDFTWDKFADWYLETSKIEKGKEKILLFVLSELLKLWHPFIPFVTEHIWSQFSNDLLMIQKYPDAKELKTQNSKFKAADQFGQLQELITELRNLRSEYRQPPGKIFASYMELPRGQEWLKKQIAIIEKLARVKMNFDEIPKDKKMPYFLWSDSGNKVYLIIPDFNPKKERALTEKELKETDILADKLAGQLDKKEFLKKAPPEIVEKLKTDYEAAKVRLQKLHNKIKTLK